MLAALYLQSEHGKACKYEPVSAITDYLLGGDPTLILA